MLINPQVITVQELQSGMYVIPFKKPRVPAIITNIIIQNAKRIDVHLHHYPLDYATVMQLEPDQEITIYERV